MPGATVGQRRALDPPELELQRVMSGCKELKPGPLQESQMLFTAEPSFQPLKLVFSVNTISGDSSGV